MSIVEHQILIFKFIFKRKELSYRTVQIKDQTARSVQSDLDLHCPQRHRISPAHLPKGKKIHQEISL